MKYRVFEMSFLLPCQLLRQEWLRRALFDDLLLYGAESIQLEAENPCPPFDLLHRQPLF